MVMTRGAFPLGEFFIFPDIQQDNGIMDSCKVTSSTMLACMYNIYLTTSNLVFQPNTRRMRIRPLYDNDALLKNPEGEST
jgi:hypothetical protein